MGWLLVAVAAPVPTAAQIDVVRIARDLVLSPGGAVVVILVVLWALVWRQMIPRQAHDAEMAAQKESYERAIRERDTQIVKLEASRDQWQQYAFFGRERLRETLDVAGAPPTQKPTAPSPPGGSSA